MDWNFFSARRRTNLKDFLSDCSTKEQALQKLSDLQLTNLPLSEINQLFTKAKIEETSEVAPEVKTEVQDTQSLSKNLPKKATKNATETPGD